MEELVPVGPGLALLMVTFSILPPAMPAAVGRAAGFLPLPEKICVSEAFASVMFLIDAPGVVFDDQLTPREDV